MTITMRRLVTQLATADIPTHREARSTYARFRASQGHPHQVAPILTAPSDNVKLAKGDVPNYGLSLAPFNVSGAVNLCPHSTRGCRALCLNTAGKGQLNSVQHGRITKTRFMVEHSGAFLELVRDELDKAVAKADGGKIGVRLNVLSDIPWEQAAPWIFDRYPGASFYDYTKDLARFERPLPANYTLTASASERLSDEGIADLLAAGGTVAIVADPVEGLVPTAWNGFPVVNGDEDDHRPSDPAGSVVWLKPKGEARKAKRGGFVRTTNGFTTEEVA